ncbi:leucyl aminopeptidase family protein [Candidatus Peregrinibacteria bacterium]|nr:leucyl aminopeptidase family protein [Candidatus Peregrinibacteria bacterium]
MTIKQIIGFLEPKNQNLPFTEIRHDFKDIPVVMVPVVEEKEKELRKKFPFLKEKVSGKKGEKKEAAHNSQIFYFVGIGKEKEMNSRNMRRFFGSAYLSASANKPKTIGLFCPPEWTKEAALGVDVAALDPAMLKPDYKKEKTPEVVLVHPDYKTKKAPAVKAMKLGQAIAEGKNLMRILGTIPPNILSPQIYADIITQLAKKWKVKCMRVPQAQLKKYGLINAVSAGSRHHSELLVLTIHPKKGKTKKATAMIGKGLCYDSGGLQGKQQYMKFMKEDMAGSASVLGTVRTIMKAGLEVRQTTHFVIGLAESMMGSQAMRADDVYTAGDGQTVEIIHTDAEGRLVLADCICYMKNNFKNTDHFYTIATLTGSCIIALGEHYTGIVCNDKELGCEAMEIGKEVGEYMHVGPWDMDYDDNNSPNASMANLGENDREAGWIKAGMFLYRFVPKAKKEEDQAKFSHFDIAASIDMKEQGKSWRRKGFSSGIGVGLLSGLLTR